MYVSVPIMYQSNIMLFILQKSTVAVAKLFVIPLGVVLYIVHVWFGKGHGMAWPTNSPVWLGGSFILLKGLL